MVRKLTPEEVDADLKEYDPDPLEWTHPVSWKLALRGEEARGRYLEKKTCSLIKEEFPEFGESIGLLRGKHKRSEGCPDINFMSPVSKIEKYIEVKSVLLNPARKGKKEVTRIKPYDQGESGNQNFDYLVIMFIHPTRGEIIRSMTHEECVKGIELNIFKWRPYWPGYGFTVNDSDNLLHTELKIYNGFECIENYERQTFHSLWGVDVDMSWLRKKDSLVQARLFV